MPAAQPPMDGVIVPNIEEDLSRNAGLICSERAVFHKLARPCPSSGADSAIVMPEDCMSNSDDSSVSSRSVSRTADLERNSRSRQPLAQRCGPPAPLQPQHPEEIQMLAREPDPTHALQAQFPGSHAAQHGQERMAETANPCLSGSRSIYGGSQHHIHPSQTCPTFPHPCTDYSLVPVRCQSVHGPHERCVPMHRMGPCGHRSAASTHSPYYTVHTGSDTMSCASSQYIFAPHQPRDVRIPDSAGCLALAKTRPLNSDSLSTNPTSIYYMDSERKASNAQPIDADSLHTDPKKNQTFRRLITKTLSSVYAIFVIVLGAILYVNDVLGTVGHSYVEVFQVYLFMIAITFYIFIHIDIRRYLKHEHNLEHHPEHQSTQLVVYPPFGAHRSANGGSASGASAKKSPIPYGFKTGRHAGSLYLKLGAVAFCFGSMIHDGLVFSKRLDIVVTQLYSSCMNIIDLFTPALNLVFSFYQLYFIFKHSNIIIHRYQELARFGIMHSIAVNLCVWFRTLVDETIDEFSRKWSGEGYDMKETANRMPEALRLMAEDAGWHAPASVSSSAVMPLKAEAATNHTNAALTACMPETVLANIAQEAAPYLYPFTIEYTLIAAAVWYMIWSNIGHQEEHHTHGPQKPHHDSVFSRYQPTEDHSDQSIKSSLYMIHVDCRSTSRGLFPGIFVLVVTVVVIIIFFVTISAEKYTAIALIINNVSELSLFGVTFFVTIFAFRQTSRLDLNPAAMKHTLDDFLLFIALPCFFIFSFFSIIAGIAASNYLSIVVNTSSMLQVVLQTIFIFDGLRRCSNNPQLQRKKPGREMITFLIVCNVAMWTFSTFEIKRSETNPSQMLFYGEFEWSIISHLSVPLTIFYRFHSSVCLVDIWRSAYQPAENH